MENTKNVEAYKEKKQRKINELINKVIKRDIQEDIIFLIKNGIIDERMYQSRDWLIRYELAKNGYFIDMFVEDIDESVKICSYEGLIKRNKIEQKHINYAIQQDDYDILLLLIKNDIVNEKMCQSQWVPVREALAKKGCFSNDLISDKDENVRYYVYRWLIRKDRLKQEHIDLAIKQDDERVLLLFIKNKVIDERMCQSQHWEVREELAKNGYFIDYLIKDKEEYVRYNAYEWLIQNNKFQQELYIDEVMEMLWKCEDKKLFFNIFECLIQYNQLKEKYIKKFVELATMCNDKGFILTLISYGINNDIKEFIDLIDVY